MKIGPEQVVCLLAQKNYTKIFLSDNKNYLVRSTLSGALKKLPSELFIKVHRSLVVSILFVETIEKDNLTIGDEALPIGRLYYKSLLKRLNIIE